MSCRATPFGTLLVVSTRDDAWGNCGCRCLQVNPNSGRSTGQAARAIESKGHGPDPAVEFVEPNFIYTTQQANSISTDTFFTSGSLWGMYSGTSIDGSPTNQYGCGAVHAWNNQITGKNV